jgi:hypothetical protein
MNVGVRILVLTENEKWLKVPILSTDFYSNNSKYQATAHLKWQSYVFAYTINYTWHTWRFNSQIKQSLSKGTADMWWCHTCHIPIPATKAHREVNLNSFFTLIIDGGDRTASFCDRLTHRNESPAPIQWFHTVKYGKNTCYGTVTNGNTLNASRDRLISIQMTVAETKGK